MPTVSPVDTVSSLGAPRGQESDHETPEMATGMSSLSLSDDHPWPQAPPADHHGSQGMFIAQSHERSPERPVWGRHLSRTSQTSTDLDVTPVTRASRQAIPLGDYRERQAARRSQLEAAWSLRPAPTPPAPPSEPPTDQQ